MHNCKERQSDARNKLSTSAFIMTSVIKELYLINQYQNVISTSYLRLTQ